MSVNFELLIFLFLFFFRGYCLAHPFHVPVTLQVHFFYGSQKDVNIWISFWQECLNFHWQSATLKQSHSWECLVQTTACQTKCLNCEVALSSKGMAGFTKTYNIPTFLVFVSCNLQHHEPTHIFTPAVVVVVVVIIIIFIITLLKKHRHILN